ncbi:alpha-amylase family protein [Pedobacter immunditicola]|uniref:alpha-amylase family protein n=1 Tax=Pedobacter immunditicola TaxID=3133440 RepID=UPI0030A074A7
MRLKHHKYPLLLVVVLFCSMQTTIAQKKRKIANHKALTMGHQKLIIYQLLPRLFGNSNTNNVVYGTIEQNGSGKFNDISEKALDGIREMGTTHVWYTGVIAHASLTDYSAYGIQPDDADVVKGRAGSPYAIRDYYDVDPDLAVHVNKRMAEFEALVKRTHAKKMKVIIDFVPNHVARRYQAYAKPANVIDFGAADDVSKAFAPGNDFYYVPGKALVAPTHPDTITTALSPLQDHHFKEFPAKATGNNVFSEYPHANDWYETIKLNYGVDYLDGDKKYFSPMPPVWGKMKDILMYWADKGVDGFRCDMAEMVPVEFWNWVIPEIKKAHPEMLFIGEAYNPQAYETYFNEGKFDYLYDKVGLYDGLKRLIRNEDHADVYEITKAWQVERHAFSHKMLRFLENHDEERIASAGFAGNALLALPAMVVSATLSGGPVMLYFGQEVGEPAIGKEGFGGDDNRSTIFDYWGVPEHQKWMNKGAFNGALLSHEQVQLRDYYKKLMQITATSPAVQRGEIFEIPRSGNMNNRMYGYIRYTAEQRLLVVVNFDRHQTMEVEIDIPEHILNGKDVSRALPLLGATDLSHDAKTITVKLDPVDAQIIEF